MKHAARYLFTFLGVCFLASPAGAVPSPQGNGFALTPEQVKTVQDINAYLNSMMRFKGNFVQIGPDGKRAGGQFHIHRPGKMRFDYDSPSPIKIVSDGRLIAIVNSRLKTTNRMPVKKTPLRFVLISNIDFLRDTNIVDFYQDGDLKTLTLEDKSKKVQGRLKLIFGGKKMALKQWVMTDAQGLNTIIEVSDITEAKKVSKGFFKIKEFKFKTGFGDN